MTTTTTSRRAVLAGAVALPALAAPAALAATKPDEALENLWEEFQARAKVVEAACARYMPVAARVDRWISSAAGQGASFEDRERGIEAIRLKYGAHEQWAAVTAAWGAQRETVAAIRTLPATTITGIALKLCTVAKYTVWRTEPDAEEYKDAVSIVLRDIDRLLGSDFMSKSQIVEYAATTDDDEDDEDDEAQS